MAEAGILECRDLKWKKIRTIRTKRQSNSSLFGCVTYKINKTRQVKTGNIRNTEPHCRNHFGCGKVFFKSEYVCSLSIQHSNGMRRIAMWPLWLCQILPHYLINGTIFKGRSWTDRHDEANSRFWQFCKRA
jgi:hypothetical protein